MKKYFFVGLFFLGLADYLRADGTFPPDHFWRSSATCSAQTDVSIATGIIRIERIIVTSGTTGVGSFEFYNASAAVAVGVVRSTSIYYNVENTEDWFIVRKVLSRGLRYTKTGNSCVEILWDWYHSALPGQKTRGRLE